MHPAAAWGPEEPAPARSLALSVLLGAALAASASSWADLSTLCAPMALQLDKVPATTPAPVAPQQGASAAPAATREEEPARDDERTEATPPAMSLPGGNGRPTRAAVGPGRAPTEPRAEEPVRLLHFKREIEDLGDLYSGSWLMNVSTFSQIDIKMILTLEDGSFEAFRSAERVNGGRPDVLAQTRDWLEFSVEHLSHYWRTALVCEAETDFDNFIAKLDHYIAGADVFSGAPFRDTIAILPFVPFDCGAKQQGHVLTARVLTATLKSLQRVGVGRAVIVALSDAALYLQTASFGDMEVASVMVSVESAKNRVGKKHLPIGAISGLQSALKGPQQLRDQWLGTRERRQQWRHVFFTEPDMILHTKASSAHGLARAVESGIVLCPHRLQPLPHVSDVPRLRNVPRDPEVVPVVGPDAECLDSGDRRPKIKGCYWYWWACGLKDGNHSMLAQYGKMRLSGGSGLTLLVGDEAGRQCSLDGLRVTP